MKEMLKFIHSLLIYFLFAACLIVNANVLVNRLSYETKPMKSDVFYLNSKGLEYKSILVVTEISKKEYEESSGINVLKDEAMFGFKKHYRIDIEIQGEELIKVEFINLKLLEKNTNNCNVYIDDNKNLFASYGNYYDFYYEGKWFFL